MRAVLIAVVEFRHILPEALFALFAGEDHFGGLFEAVRLGFGVAFGAVEPLFAAGGAD